MGCNSAGYDFFFFGGPSVHVLLLNNEKTEIEERQKCLKVAEKSTAVWRVACEKYEFFTDS